MTEDSIYTFPNLPRQRGTYQMYCPDCAEAGTVRTVKVKISKTTNSHGCTAWAYHAVTCRKCGTMRFGLLPSAWAIAEKIGTLPKREVQS